MTPLTARTINPWESEYVGSWATQTGRGAQVAGAVGTAKALLDSVRALDDASLYEKLQQARARLVLLRIEVLLALGVVYERKLYLGACRRTASAAARAALLRPPLLGRRFLDVPAGTPTGRLGRSGALATRIGVLATKPPARRAPNGAVWPFSAFARQILRLPEGNAGTYASVARGPHKRPGVAAALLDRDLTPSSAGRLLPATDDLPPHAARALVDACRNESTRRVERLVAQAVLQSERTQRPFAQPRLVSGVRMRRDALIRRRVGAPSSPRAEAPNWTPVPESQTATRILTRVKKAVTASTVGGNRRASRMERLLPVSEASRHAVQGAGLPTIGRRGGGRRLRRRCGAKCTVGTAGVARTWSRRRAGGAAHRTGWSSSTAFPSRLEAETPSRRSSCCAGITTCWTPSRALGASASAPSWRASVPAVSSVSWGRGAVRRAAPARSQVTAAAHYFAFLGGLDLGPWTLDFGLPGLDLGLWTLSGGCCAALHAAVNVEVMLGMGIIGRERTATCPRVPATGDTG